MDGHCPLADNGAILVYTPHLRLIRSDADGHAPPTDPLTVFKIEMGQSVGRRGDTDAVQVWRCPRRRGRGPDRAGRRWDGQRRSARTAPQQACAATAAIANSWGGGFIAAVTVRNVGTETLDAWRVSWQWPGDQRVLTAWNAVPEGSGAGVTFRNAAYNGTLAPGASTTFGMLVAGSVPPGGIAPTCAR